MCKRQPIVFRPGKAPAGVIGHNLVDSLIYKQSLMKFLVFINNALQPRYPSVCVGVSALVPRNTSPFSLFLTLYYFGIRILFLCSNVSSLSLSYIAFATAAILYRPWFRQPLFSLLTKTIILCYFRLFLLVRFDETTFK